MQCIESDTTFPISSAVVHNGRIFEAVVTGIPDGASRPVAGGIAEEMRECFRQLDILLAAAGVDRYSVCTARLYLQDVLNEIGAVNLVWQVQDVLNEIGAVNLVWQVYFGTHPVVRRAYGVQLQSGMRIEAAFTAELPS